MFMTLVRTIKSGWLKYFIAVITRGNVQFFWMIETVPYCRIAWLGWHWCEWIDSWGKKQNTQCTPNPCSHNEARWPSWGKAGRECSWSTSHFWGWWTAKSRSWWQARDLDSLTSWRCQLHWTRRNDYMTTHLLEHLFLLLRVILNHVRNVPSSLLLHDLLVESTAVEQLLELVVKDSAWRWRYLNLWKGESMDLDVYSWYFYTNAIIRRVWVMIDDW